MEYISETFIIKYLLDMYSPHLIFEDFWNKIRSCSEESLSVEDVTVDWMKRLNVGIVIPIYNIVD